MNKPVYLGLLIPRLSEILMYEFWYDYVKQKEDIETRFDTSNYELDRPLPTGKLKK